MGDPDLPLGMALVLAELSLGDLWLRYLALGGMATTPELRAYVDGSSEVGFDSVEHDVLAHAFNERFREMDLDHHLRYHRP